MSSSYYFKQAKPNMSSQWQTQCSCLLFTVDRDWVIPRNFVTVIFVTQDLLCNNIISGEVNLVCYSLLVFSDKILVEMQSVVRAASLGQLSRVSSSVVPNLSAPVGEPHPMTSAPGVKLEPPALPLTSSSMAKQLLTGNQRITSGLGGNC